MVNSIPIHAMQKSSIQNIQYEYLPVYTLKILNMENKIYGRTRSISTVQSYTKYSVRGGSGKWSLCGCKRRLNKLHPKDASLVTKAGTRKPMPISVRATGLW